MNSVNTTRKKSNAVRGKSQEDATSFMLYLIRGRLSLAEIETQLVKPISESELSKLCEAALDEPPWIRRRAQAVIFHQCGITLAAIMRVLIVGRNTVKRYIRRFKAGGADGLLERAHWKAGTKLEDVQLRELVLATLRAPPSTFEFNRTSWTVMLMKRAL